MEESSTSFFSSMRTLLMLAIVISSVTVVILIVVTEFGYPRPKIRLINEEQTFPFYDNTSLRRREENVLFNLSSNIKKDHGHSNCSILLVVKGYFLYFQKAISKSRTIWCPSVNCTVSLLYSNNISDVLSSNITFFSHLTRLPSAKKLRYLLEHRRPEQRWALMSLETPLRVARNTSLPASISKNFFHWLATYDPASEIPITYGQVVSFTNGDFKPQRVNYFELKSKMVAFVSSNCIHSKWRRLDFVKALQRYIPVDIYGKCGNLTCDVEADCTDILRQYKFILALENSPCPGYITEKFWNAVGKFESVAVVWGANAYDYEQYAPPQSFILVESFPSIKHLASHLWNVSSNKTLYNTLHDWRMQYSVRSQDKLATLPNNEALCRAADLYINETTDFLSKMGGARYKHTNGKDWIQSCRIPVHTKMKEFPIPE
ncbi:Glycoprotein 3-alpha-L-fucosyltransferase A [Holothuria leucospilota]|uniref:Fucosyltransferase n=1 Tax=Holothuria leucospilota TaxID=206669 RepID=A0A9Q1BSE7_HOLLE|nr:Glycoprotein 3-alpha-L-fucosyltransferase A [Holothuria leucospilota]